MDDQQDSSPSSMASFVDVYDNRFRSQMDANLYDILVKHIEQSKATTRKRLHQEMDSALDQIYADIYQDFNSILSNASCGNDNSLHIALNEMILAFNVAQLSGNSTLLKSDDFNRQMSNNLFNRQSCEAVATVNKSRNIQQKVNGNDPQAIPSFDSILFDLKVAQKVAKKQATNLSEIVQKVMCLKRDCDTKSANNTQVPNRRSTHIEIVSNDNLINIVSKNGNIAGNSNAILSANESSNKTQPVAANRRIMPNPKLVRVKNELTTDSESDCDCQDCVVNQPSKTIVCPNQNPSRVNRLIYIENEHDYIKRRKPTMQQQHQQNAHFTSHKSATSRR